MESINTALRDGLARLKRKSKAYSKSTNMLTLSVELWMYRDMIRINVEKYCIYNRERKCPLKKKEFLDNNNSSSSNNKKNINNRKKEKNKNFGVVS